MLLNDNKRVLKWQREKSDVIFQSVTMRIPKDLYEDYKKSLEQKGKLRLMMYVRTWLKLLKKQKEEERETK